MKALRVDAWMVDGRVATSDLYLPLDSLLAWSWIFEHEPERLAMTTSGIAEEIYHPPVPLKRVEIGDDWWYACSFAIGETAGERTTFWHKRFDAQIAEDYADFGGRRAKVNSKSGPYKGYRMPITIFLIPRLTWYCVGDATEIRELLENVTHIGKKRSQGYGRIRRWAVGETSEDLSWMRPTPDENGDEVTSIRPPYWESSNLRVCKWPPGSERLLCRREVTISGN